MKRHSHHIVDVKPLQNSKWFTVHYIQVCERMSPQKSTLQLDLVYQCIFLILSSFNKYWIYGYRDGYYGSNYSSGYIISCHTIPYHIISCQTLHPLSTIFPSLECVLEVAPAEVQVNGRANGRRPVGEAHPLHGTTCLIPQTERVSMIP